MKDRNSRRNRPTPIRPDNVIRDTVPPVRSPTARYEIRTRDGLIYGAEGDYIERTCGWFTLCANGDTVSLSIPLDDVASIRRVDDYEPVPALAVADDADESPLDEARMWARHGYEIGQRHCGWSDHGVAPAWLTDGWPNSFDSCEHLKQASEYDTALSRVRSMAEHPEIMDAQHADSAGYLHGYGVAIRAAKRMTGRSGEPTEADPPVDEPSREREDGLAACCVCGHGFVAYYNYKEQPFCEPCANCNCGQTPCVRTSVTASDAVSDKLSTDLSTQLRNALGLDNDPAIDALAAVRHMAQELAHAREAIRSVVHLHMGVSNDGQVICGHCSGLDDQGTTDNSPIGYPCDTVKRIWEANDERPTEPTQEGRPS